MENSMIKVLNHEQVMLSISNNASTSSSSTGSGNGHEINPNSSAEEGDIRLISSRFSYILRGWELDLGRVLLAEMMGSFILMFCIAGIIGSRQIMQGQVGLMEYASTAGITVVVIIFSIGPISGAHVNPSVTIAFATFGHFPWSKVPLYLIAQTVGATLAAYMGKYVYRINPELLVTQPSIGCASAFWVEFIATFMLMFLTASLMHDIQSIAHLTGFIIGLAIGLAVLITGPISGGSMNPARSLGPAIAAWSFKNIWIYLTAPILGSIAGALMYHALRTQRRPCGPNASTPEMSLYAPPTGSGTT